MVTNENYLNKIKLLVSELYSHMTITWASVASQEKSFLMLLRLNSVLLVR